MAILKTSEPQMAVLSAAPRLLDFQSSDFREGRLVVQTGLLLFFSVAGVAGLSAMYLLCGGRLDLVSSRAILVGGWVIAALAAQRLSPARLIYGLASAAIITAMALALCHHFFDLTWDGQGYHYVAVRSLADGVNPYSDPPIDYARRWPDLWAPTADPLHDRLFHFGAEWANYFPKLGWMFAAVHVAAGFSDEASKAGNIVIFAAAYLCVLGTFLNLNFGRLKAAILSFALTANTAFIAEIFSRMNDGMLGGLVTIFVALSTLSILHRSTGFAWAAGAAVALALNLKFSAIPLFGCLCIGLCLAALAVRGWRSSFMLAAPLFTSAVFALGVLGYAPYVQNALNHGHPLYPAMGVGAVDIMQDAWAAPYRDRPAWQSLIHSLFSESSGQTAQLKLPFQVRAAELTATGPDVWAGGFGPLFSGALVVSFALLLIYVVKRPVGRPTMLALASLLGAIVVASLVQPASYVFRYVPALWLFPGLAAIPAIVSGTRWLRTTGWICIAVLCANIAIEASAALRFSSWGAREVRAQIATFQARNRMVCLRTGGFPSRIEHFKAAGVPVRAQLGRLTCDAVEPVPFTWVGQGGDWQWGSACNCSQPQQTR